MTQTWSTNWAEQLLLRDLSKPGSLYIKWFSLTVRTTPASPSPPLFSRSLIISLCQTVVVKPVTWFGLLGFGFPTCSYWTLSVLRLSLTPACLLILPFACLPPVSVSVFRALSCLVFLDTDCDRAICGLLTWQTTVERFWWRAAH